MRSIALALVAAVTLGLFIYFLGLGSREGSALSTLLGARVGSLGLLGALAVGRGQSLRVGRSGAFKLVAIGLCDVAANALFALASGRGLLSLVSVLGALYPVMTVVLAHVLLGERLTLRQDRRDRDRHLPVSAALRAADAMLCRWTHSPASC